MRRHIFTLALFLTLYGLVLISPIVDIESSNRTLTGNTETNSFTVSGIGDNIEDLVDQISDIRFPSDKGTHNTFSDLQDYGTNYDRMTEVDTGHPAYNLEDFVDQQSNLHDPSDIGTHTSFAEMQDLDGSYDTLTESAYFAGSFDVEYVESLIESTYNAAANNWQTKCTLTIGPTSGTKYYIVLATAEIQASSATYRSLGRLYVDSTTTEYQVELQPKDVTDYTTFFTVYYVSITYPTEVQLNLQYATTNTANIVRIRDARIISIGLDAAVEAYDEDLTRVTQTTTTPATISQITVTPDGASEDFIIISSFVYDYGNTFSSGVARLYDGSSSLQEDWQEPVNAAGRYPFAHIRYVTVTSATTYYNQYRSESSGTTSGASYSHLLAVPASVFDNIYYNSATASSTPTAVNTWESKVTNTYTPEAGDHLIIGTSQYRSASTSESASVRLSYNGVTDNDAITEDKDVSDWHSHCMFTRSTLAAASTTDIIQMWDEGTTLGAGFQQAWLFSIELAPPPIPCMLDLEVGWTSVDYDEENEYLCIYGGTQDAEALMVDIWSGSSWTNVIVDVAVGWNNVSVSSYIASSSFEIRFVDSSQSSDSSQGSWQIEGVVLHCWTEELINYELDLEIGWTGADNDEIYEQLCIYPVTGGGWPSEDIKVDIWNGAWVNVIADLIPDQWNNVSIASYLVSSTTEIRFLGGTETGDTAQNTWEIDAVLIHTWTPSYAPVIDQMPTLDNPTDTDNMYAQYQEYRVTVYVSDQNGFADIDFLEIGLWDDSRATEFCRFRYDEDTNVFSEEFDGGTYVSLNTGSSSAIESGNDTDATFYFTIDWDFPDSTDIDARCYVVDTQVESTTTWYEVDWDIETRLDYSVSPSISDGSGTPDRGSVDGSFSLTGTVIYYGSVDDVPSSTAVDVWVSASEYGTNVGPWSDLTLTSGAFDVICYADNLVGQDTYTIKVVEEGTGSGGNDLFYTTSATDTYIADQLVVTITNPVDQRINVGANATGIIVSAIYDYDDSSFDGTLTLNDTTFDYGTVGLRGYEVSTASGGAHGVSLIGINDETYCIWDSLTITITDPLDQRININANASGIVVTAVYDYDSTPFDGTLTLNNTQFVYAVAQRQGYTVVSASGGAYGITAISANDATWCIWDSVAITITDPSDQRININTNASGIIVSAIYDYDGSTFDGVLALNNTQFAYSTPQIQYYTVLSISGGLHGITAISSNDVTYCIWDSLTVTITDPSDQRININANASGIVVTAVYNYDSTPFEGTLNLNNTEFAYGTAQIQYYTVQSASGGLYGITTISANDVTYCIWDSLTITITGPSDQRININANASGILVSAIYDYDSSPFDGTLGLNNTQFSYATAQIQGYSVDSVIGGAHGITAISVNDVTYCIWDSLTIVIANPSDQRININANATGIIVSATYDYDDTAFDGTLNLNSTQFTYSFAQRQGYTVQSVSGGIYGITAISVNDVTYCIWDSLTVTITDPTDQRININMNASGIVVTAVYDYDGTVFDGSLTLNNTQFSYALAQVQWYTVQSVSGGAYGITAISANDMTYCIWDSLRIVITDPIDQRININTNASGIIVTAVYEYDDSTFDGILTLNNTLFTYSSAQIQWYSVQSASGGAHGITTISSNDVTYCIWDSLTITITGPSDSRININANASGIVVSAVHDYDSMTFDGMLTLNNTQFVYTTAQIQWYTVQGVNGGAHGITAISANDVTYCIWDSLTIAITGPNDQRINVNSNASGIVVTAIYDYDGAAFDGTFTLNNTQFVYAVAQRQGYTVQSVSGGIYGITAISTNDVTYCIWDSLTIVISDPLDQRINVDANVTGIIVTATYDYDGAVFDGTLSLNNSQFTYSNPQKQAYTVQSVSGGIYGITAISTNDMTYCIWDSLTISITGPSDQRININTNASGIVVTAVYDYDGAEFDGVLTLNNTLFAYSTAQIQWYTVQGVSGGTYGITAVSANDAIYCIWDSLTVSLTDPSDQRTNINANATGIIMNAIYDYDGSIFDGVLTLNNSQFSYGTAQIQWYTVGSASGGAFGITAISSNDATYCIWDSLTITITDPLDSRINVNTNATGILVSATYDYDGSVFDGTLTLNNTQFSYPSAQIQWYTVSSASGGVYGITAVSVNDVTYCVWDSLTILITGPTDQRININTNATGTIMNAIYDYDGSAFDGVLTLNNSQFTYGAAQIQWYTIESVSGGAFGITAISNNDVTYCIWDSLTITITDSLDQRININANASGIVVSAIYDYDGTPFDGMLTLNNSQFSYGTAQIQWYSIQTVSGGTHGISTVSSSDATYCIWDSLTIVITDPFDQRIDISTNASGLIVAAVYDYDGSTFDGVLTLNNTQFMYSTAQIQWYTVLSAIGGTHGITVISANDATYCIWDSLTITISDPSDQRISTNTNASGIVVSAVYDYDGSVFDGVLTLNNTQFTYGTAQIQGYTVNSVSGGTHGIRAISANDATYCIWDQLVITIGVDDSTPLNGVQANFSLTVIFDYNNTVCTSYQIVIQRNNTWWQSFTSTNWSLFVDINNDTTYTYAVRLITSESLYSILSFSTNSVQVVWAAEPNIAPVNDAAPVLTNPDDASYMYAMYRFYIITSNVSDADGYDDIVYVELTLYDDSRTAAIWTVRYTVTGDTFSVQLGSAYITLSALSSASMSGNELNITWYIEIDWDHSDLSNVDVKQYVYDGASGVEDFYESNWDVETRLEVVGLAVEDGTGTSNRGPLDGSFVVSGTVIYLGSVNDYPLSGETDVWVLISEYGTTVGPWSDLVLVSGQFSITAYADNQVGLDTITIKVVEEGAGSGSTDLLGTSTESTYIADRILVQAYAALDDRVNIGGIATIDVTLVYEYDASLVINGMVTANGLPASHQGLGVWRFTDSESAVIMNTYDTVAYTGGTHGLTQANQNSISQGIVWDQIVVQSTVADDTRVSIGDAAEIRVTLWLAYDSTYLGSGDSVTLDGTLMTWDAGNSWFEVAVSRSSVGRWMFVVNSSASSVYGITELDTNSLSAVVIWDQIVVQTTVITDSHVGVGSSTEARVTLWLAYDHEYLGDGDSVTMDDSPMSWNSVNSWWQYEASQFSVGKWAYFVNSSIESTYGITVLTTNGLTVEVIWDQIVVQSTVADDTRVNIGDSVEIRVTLWLAYDHIYLGSGDTVTLDDSPMTWDSTNSWFELIVTQSSADSWSYFVNSTSQAGFGITAMDLNSQAVSVIWDRIVVQTTVVDDSRLSTGDNAEVRVTLMLEYDNTYLGPGDSVTLDGRLMTWDAVSSWFELPCTQLSVGDWAYFVNSSHHVGYDITALDLSGHSVSIIWDRVLVQSYSASDERANIGDSVSIDVTLRFEYDNALVDSGTVAVNGISAVSQGLGVWRFTDSESAVGMNTYNLVACSGNAYGITSVNQNAQSISAIWDQLVIEIGVYYPSMHNGLQANFTLTVTFDYDDSVCSTYQIVINRNSTWWHSFIGANVSFFVDVGYNISYSYTTRSISFESNYSITAFSTNTRLVTWSPEPNNPPMNDSAPTLTNGDDTDRLYARYRYYTIIASASDPDGYADISYVELSLYSNDRVTLYWTVRYTRATDTFSVEMGGTVVVIGSMSNAVGAETTLTITWYLKIDWSHADIIDSDVEQSVFDGIDSDIDPYETNWNVETRLDYSAIPSLSGDHGDVNTADLVASGSITYYGSTLSPLANETDIWIVHDISGTWIGDLTAGSFSISGIGSSASVRLNTYTFRIVAEGTGSGGADLYFSTSPTDTFITDRIQVYLAGVVDSRININSYCEVWWRARYEYNGTEIQSGLLIQLNGSRTLVWNAAGSYWRWLETSPTPKSAGFSILSAAESFYGLTEWTDSTIELQVIWDALIITVTDPTDMRTNVGTNATGIHVSAIYAYDGATFDGILTLNNTVFSYATPQIQSYTVISATSDSFGITAILSNDVAYCIWDRVLVASITADELYHDPGDNVRVTVSLQYEYDASSVTSGTFAIGGHSLTHIGSGLWETYVTEATYQAVSFDLLTLCNASLYGITGFNMASNEVTVYWDRIEFYSVSVDDGRLGIGDSALIQWSARLENAGTIIPNGVVVMMTGDIACIPSGGVYVASVMQSAVGSRTFSIISASLGEIGSYIQSAADPTIIWDRVQVTSITATSLSQDVGVATEIRVTLVYEFDESPFTSGSVSLSGATNAMTYNSAGAYWSVSVTKNTAGNYTFAVESISDSMYGISALDSASLSVEIAWVALPGFTPDTMTLLLIGGGVGVGLIGVALIASRRRRGATSVRISDIEPSDFGIYDATATAPSEPDIAQTSTESVEPEPDIYPPAELSDSEVHEPLEAPPAAELATIEETEPTSISVDEVHVTEEVLPTEPVREEPLPVEAVEIETIEAVTAPETAILPESGHEIEAEKPLTKEELLDRLPPEVRDAIPKEDLEKMSRKEAQSLVDSYTPPEEPLSEPITSSADTGAPDIALRTKELSRLDKKSLVALLPPEIKETISPDELKRLSKKELVSLLASYMEPE